MSTALQQVGIPGILVCQWGVPYQNPTDGSLQGPATWTPPMANSFRVSDDIAPGWANVLRIMNQNIHVIWNDASGPGHWADMDLLEVGNSGMTIVEQASHFAIWAMFKSSLMISTNVPSMSEAVREILLNRDLIAINQDAAGKPVKLIQRFSHDKDVFAGPLENGDLAVLVLDHSNTSRVLELELALLGISEATVKNLWTGEIVENVFGIFSETVKPHGSLPLRLSNILLSPGPPSSGGGEEEILWIEAESGLLSSSATLQPCSSCSNSTKVGSLTNSSSLTLTFPPLSSSSSSTTTQNLLFDYINCEIGYLSSQGPNTRRAAISVNDGPVQEVLFPLSGYDWERDVARAFVVRLEGFGGEGENRVRIGGVEGFAPDFDRVGWRG